MLLTFLKHQWTGFSRSKSKEGTMVIQIVLFLVAVYLISVSVFIGSHVNELVEEFLPGKDVMLVFNGVILYYFVLDFLLRIQMQELPTLAIVPYLHLNIAKRKLVSFLNIRALFNVFNLLPLLLFFPFCLLSIRSNYGPAVSVMYLVSILSLALFNNYTTLYFKRAAAQNIKLVVAGLLLLFTFAALEYFKILSIARLSNDVFHLLTLYPATGLIFAFLAAGIYWINARFLRNNLYLEELKTGEKKKIATDYPFLNRFGDAGMLIAVEIKLILRNKRPRAVVSKGILFLCYGFLMYKEKALLSDSFGVMLVGAIFMTGNMTLLYGQFMFGWQSAEFDGLLANKTDIKTFFKAKMIMLTLASTLLTIVVSLYGFMSWKLLLLQSAAYLYNIGVSTIIVLAFANRNNKYIDLSKGSNFNWQGVGSSSMLMSFPILLSPYVIYIPLALLINPYWGLAGLAITGIAGLLTRNYWINYLVRRFHIQKYQIAAGFRERT